MAVAGGLVWFDHLNVIDIKTTLAPVYKFLGIQGRSQLPAAEGEIINLDAERLAVRLEALDLQAKELEKNAAEIAAQRTQIEQMAAEIETRQQGLDEREKSMTATEELGAVRNKNVEQIAKYLAGIPPESAVANLLALDDQYAIDILRKVEELAQAAGTASIVSFWFSLMPPERAADLQRKMIERPD
jgi:flagellar protein FlbB